MTANSILTKIHSPSDMNRLNIGELTTLGTELRELIVDVVSKNGGHLAPSLGVVELTMALLNVFDAAKDKIVWDVGHQAYVYKILTGRADAFHTLRQMGGVSGFPKRSESPYDAFGVGHSSTSISAALGLAEARDLKGENHKVCAVIGDGSLTAGMAFEGLNKAGEQQRDLVVVLNDNEMSISKNVGALSKFLSRNLSRQSLRRLKKDVEGRLGAVPRIGDDLLSYFKRSEDSLKTLFTPGLLFQAFDFNYVGPINGHNLGELIDVFKQVRDLDGPHLVHVMTVKGRGYEFAENNPTYFHGVGCFEPETGKARKFGSCELPSYTKVFGSTLCNLARKNDRILTITAAMPEGTGLAEFSERFPERFMDVGIAEQHAVTYAAGLAAEGFKPFVAIYSTFMQRSYDQIVHDVCLQDLPVTLCLDRGGLVGEDGPTHHGAFDFSYLRHIPNMTVMAPKDEAELQRMLVTAVELNGPVALRYPRGVGVGAELHENPECLPVGEGEILRDGKDAYILAIGSRVHPALEAAQELEKEQGLSVGVFNARFVKPLPKEDIRRIVGLTKKILTVEENALMGGFGSAVLELLAEDDLLSDLRIKRLGLPDSFVEHGKQKELRALVGVDSKAIAKAAVELVKS